MEVKKLNLGCGSIRPEGWDNNDSSLNAFFLQKYKLLKFLIQKIFNLKGYDSTNVKYMNLNKKWIYNSNSVEVVYASHLFEHLNKNSAKLFLTEAHRVLKINGRLRLVGPDLLQHTKDFLHQSEARNKDTRNVCIPRIK